MKLFRATNGYIGFSDVHCYVVAESEERARELATDKFKEVELYKENYWNDLEIEYICDCDKEFATDVSD